MARCRGLLSTGEAAERHFLEALRRHGESARPFDRARTELCFGESCAATAAAPKRVGICARLATPGSGLLAG